MCERIWRELNRLTEPVRTQGGQCRGCLSGGGHQGEVLGQPQPPKEQSSDGASRHNIHQEVAEGASPVVLVVLAPSRALLVSMPPGPPRAADSAP